ncbi:MAG: sigma-70 family RNA polymerase sigma factor [Gemmatimonadales bacterium]|nr:sigma-70 family RNA polymerase sigma factor [Gemmatimonadales bacterium]
MATTGMSGGDDALAPDLLLTQVYDELRTIARHHMRGERHDHTLVPTALVHEAYLSLYSRDAATYADRSHFLSAASRAMRHILVDHARSRRAGKRDGGVRITLDEAMAVGTPPELDLLELDDALVQLEAAEPRWARVVELRFFAGLELPEIAALLEVSTATVKRDWQFAKAWLARTLELHANG